MRTPVKGSHVEGFNAPVVNRNLANVRTARSRLSNENMAKAGYKSKKKNLMTTRVLANGSETPVERRNAAAVEPFDFGNVPKIPNGMTLNEYLKIQKGAKRQRRITRKRKRSITRKH